jgi:HAD superfamily hydrolase (TIGR01509 family)
VTARYSHVLFDHDGVLVNTEPLYFEATRTKLAELGVDLPLPYYLELQADGRNAWAAAQAKGCDEDAIAAKRAERDALYQRLLRDQPIDIPDVERVLGELRKDVRMAIVTTAKQSDFDLIHAQRTIVGHMDFVLTNKDYARSKPHPEPYLTALARFGIQPHQALVVEDSERGLKAAVAAGIDCAVVHHPFTASQNFSDATYRIGKLDDLKKVLNVQ